MLSRHTLLLGLCIRPTEARVCRAGDPVPSVFRTSVRLGHFAFCFFGMLNAESASRNFTNVVFRVQKIKIRLLSTNQVFRVCDVLDNFKHKSCFPIMVPCGLQLSARIYSSAQMAQMRAPSTPEVNGRPDIETAALHIPDHVDCGATRSLVSHSRTLPGPATCRHWRPVPLAQVAPRNQMDQSCSAETALTGSCPAAHRTCTTARRPTVPSAT